MTVTFSSMNRMLSAHFWSTIWTIGRFDHALHDTSRTRGRHDRLVAVASQFRITRLDMTPVKFLAA
jgi:hypothetical protein